MLKMAQSGRWSRGGASGDESGRELRAEGISPDALREAIREGLFALDDEQWVSLRDELLAGLERAGLNLGACLFLVGHSVTVLGELTPCDVAQLIRYVRINEPQMLQALEEPLDRLLAASGGDNRDRESRRAA